MTQSNFTKPVCFDSERLWIDALVKNVMLNLGPNVQNLIFTNSLKNIQLKIFIGRMSRSQYLTIGLRTVGIDVNFSSISQQQFHDFKRSGFRAIVQSRVSFDGFSVDVSFSIDEKSGDFQVTFVASNHQASVTMSIGNFNICKRLWIGVLIQSNFVMTRKIVLKIKRFVVWVIDFNQLGISENQILQ